MRNLWLLFVIGLATGFVGEKLFVLSQPSSSSADDLYIEGHSSGDLPVDDEDDEDFNSGSGSGDFTPLIDVIQNEARLRNFSFHGSEVLPTQEVVPSDPPATTWASPPNQPTTAENSQDPPTTAENSQDPPTTAEDALTSSYILPEQETETESEMMLPDMGGTADCTRHLSSTTTEYPSLPPSQTSSPTDSSNRILTKEEDEVENVTEDTKKDVEEEVREEFREEVIEEVGAADGRGSRIFDAEDPEEVTSESLWERTEVLAAVIACGVVGFLCALLLLLLVVYRMKKKDEGSYDLGDTKMPPTAYQKAPTKEFYA